MEQMLSDAWQLSHDLCLIEIVQTDDALLELICCTESLDMSLCQYILPLWHIGKGVPSSSSVTNICFVIVSYMLC